MATHPKDIDLSETDSDSVPLPEVLEAYAHLARTAKALGLSFSQVVGLILKDQEGRS